MTLEGRMNNVYFDCTGKQILVGDLLKVYHYGSGNQTRYMYHVAVMEETKDFPVMSVRDYDSVTPHCRMYVVADNEQRVIYRAKIIHEKDWQTKRQKIKINALNKIK